MKTPEQNALALFIVAALALFDNANAFVPRTARQQRILWANAAIVGKITAANGHLLHAHQHLPLARLWFL